MFLFRSKLTTLFKIATCALLLSQVFTGKRAPQGHIRRMSSRSVLYFFITFEDIVELEKSDSLLESETYKLMY